MLIIAETQDHWRKIRDSEGSECWVHQRMLVARSHVLVLQDALLRARPSATAQAKARLEAGLLLEFESADKDFARVKTAGVSGWVETAALWGVDAAARH